MARKKDPVAPLVESVVADVAEHLRGEGTGLMERVEAAGSMRAARLETASARLAEHLGNDHPRVERLRQRRALLDGAVTHLQAARQRLASAPVLRDHEWLAHGRVVTERGEPLAGMTVKVFDKDRKYDDLLGDTVTDESGEFRAVYHARDFAETNENLPELYVMVFDPSGKALFVSDAPVQPSPGRADFFEIVLTDTRLKEGVPRTRCEATTAKGARCKNPAVPGGSLCARHLSGGG